MVQISGAFVSECGPRERNEDYAAWQRTSNGDYIALVADGMGGGVDGHLFSSRTVARMMARILGTSHESPTEVLFAAVEGTAADLLAQRLEKAEYALSGSTLCAVLIRPAAASAQVWLAWIGDSRIYRVASNGKLDLLTEDHVYARQLHEAGMSEQEAKAHPEAARLTASLGDRLTLEPRQRFFDELTLLPGDRLLLCSDGVSKFFENAEAELARLITEGTSAEAALRLTTRALERGSRDNVTALVVVTVPAKGLRGGSLFLAISGAGVLIAIVVLLLLFKPNALSSSPPTMPLITGSTVPSVSATQLAPSPPTLEPATSTSAPSLTPLPTKTPTPTLTPTRTATPRPSRTPTLRSLSPTPTVAVTTVPPPVAPTTPVPPPVAPTTPVLPSVAPTTPVPPSVAPTTPVLPSVQPILTP